jgi:hypothetical protein
VTTHPEGAIFRFDLPGDFHVAIAKTRQQIAESDPLSVERSICQEIERVTRKREGK